MADTTSQLLLGSGLTVVSHPLMYVKMLVQVSVGNGGGAGTCQWFCISGHRHERSLQHRADCNHLPLYQLPLLCVHVGGHTDLYYQSPLSFHSLYGGLSIQLVHHCGLLLIDLTDIGLCGGEPIRILIDPLFFIVFIYSLWTPCTMMFMGSKCEIPCVFPRPACPR